MKKRLAILAFLLTIFPMMIITSCNTRKKSKEDTLKVNNYDSTQFEKQIVANIDTSKKASKSNSSSDEQGTRETTIYPTKGKPITIENGETFTGEVDSTKTKTTYHKHKQRQAASDEKKGISNHTSKVDSNTTHNATVLHTIVKNTETKLDIMRTLELIGVLAILAFLVFMFMRWRLTGLTSIGKLFNKTTG